MRSRQVGLAFYIISLVIFFSVNWGQCGRNNKECEISLMGIEFGISALVRTVLNCSRLRTYRGSGMHTGVSSKSSSRIKSDNSHIRIYLLA